MHNNNLLEEANTNITRIDKLQPVERETTRMREAKAKVESEDEGERKAS